MTKDAREFATVRWVQRRFRPARGSAPEGTTMRNLMGQLDGTVNPVPGGAEFDAAFWTTGPGWFAGGTVLVLRRGKLDRLRGNGFGVLGLVQSIGDLGASLVVGLLWAAVSPTVAFGYAAAWMAASLLASGLLWAPAGPTADTPDRVG